MTIAEIKKYLEEFKDSDDVKEFLGSMQIPEADIVAKYKASNDFKDELKREGDRRVTAGVEKFRSETMPKHIEEEITKRFPKETEDQKELRKLAKQVEELTTEKKRESLKLKATTALTDKKLSLKLMDFINAEDDEELTSKVDNLYGIISEMITSGVNDKIKGGSPEPGKSSSKTLSGVITNPDDLKGMSHENIMKLAREDKINIPGINLGALKQ